MASSWQNFGARYSFAAVVGTVAVFFFAPFLAESPSFALLAGRVGIDWVGMLERIEVQPVEVPAPARVASRAMAKPTPVSPSPAAKGGWGVVSGLEVPAYSKEGKFLRTLPSAALLDIETFANNDQLAVCRSVEGVSDLEGFVVRVSQIERGSGPLSAAPEREKSLRVRKATLVSELATAKQELAEKARAKNPHYADYKRAKDAYDEFVRRAKDLTRKRDTAVGSADRVEYGEQLHAMRGEGTTLSQAYEAANKEYKAWIAANGEPQAPADDPRLTELTGQIEAVDKEIAGLGGAGGAN